MRVFIAEKPKQGVSIALFLGCKKRNKGYIEGNNTIVTWGIGHLLRLADPEEYDEKYAKWNLDDLPIIPEVWKLDQIPEVKQQLTTVKNCISKADEVVVATDADREGEVVGRLILGYARYNGPTKRVRLSGLDDTSIKRAFDKIKDISEYDSLFYAGLARQRADWIAGFNYTRACSLIYGGHGNVFSVGRVQTPTLRLVVERDLEIENFKSKDFFGLTGVFRDLEANWIVPESAKGDEEGRCLDQSIVKAVFDKCTNKDAKVVEATKKAKEQKAPLCLTLSDLQKIVNTKYSYTADDILNIAQSLYDTHKATSYPRSSCGYLPVSQKADVDTILSNLKGFDDLIAKCDSSFVSKVWNDKKVDEASHHGIIPTTNPSVDLSAMTEKEKNVYDIIVRYYLAQFMGNYKYNESFAALECENERFAAKGVVPTSLGWKQVIKPTKEEDKDDSKELPRVEQGEMLPCKSLNILNKKTTPPSHYIEGTLISAMKNCGRKIEDQDAKEIFAEIEGIGREATRSSIIEKLKKINYIRLKGKYLISTDKGREVIKNLPEKLSSVMITAEWEQKLSKIAKGQHEYKIFMNEVIQKTKSDLEFLINQKGSIKKIVQNPCPKCQSEMIRLKSKPPKKGFYWMCDVWIRSLSELNL